LRQAASPKSKRRHHDKKDNSYSYCLGPVVISQRPEQLNHPNRNHESRCHKAAAIKVPGEESVHKIAEDIHASPGGTSSIALRADSTVDCPIRYRVEGRIPRAEKNWATAKNTNYTTKVNAQQVYRKAAHKEILTWDLLRRSPR
jgi:hypothetical protein